MAGAVNDLEIIDLDLARTDCLHRLSIAILRHTQSVRMNDAILGQIIMEIDTYLRAAPGADNRPEVVPWQVLHGHARAA